MKVALGSEVAQINLGSSSEGEALSAADKLGAPKLARYSHPLMMSFCASLMEKYGTQSIRHEQAQIGDMLLSDPPELNHGWMVELASKMKDAEHAYHVAAVRLAKAWIGHQHARIRGYTSTCIHGPVLCLLSASS